MPQNQQTLQELLQDRVAQFASSEKPVEIIDSHLEKLFDDVIRNQFRSFGEMGKAIEEAVKEAMPANISKDFELTRYNNLIVNAIREKWDDSSMPAEMVRRATESLEKAIGEMEIPETVKLSEILESFVEQHSEEAIQNQWEGPRVSFKESGVVSGFMHVFFDKDPDGRGTEYSMDNHLHIRLDEGHRPDDTQPEGKIISAVVDGDVMGRKQGGWYSKYERLMVALYYGGARLVIDCDEGDFSYPGYD